MALRKERDKDRQLQVGVTGEEFPVKAVMLVGTDGTPYTAGGGGGGGGSFDGQLTQGGADVSESNPLPTEDQSLVDAIVIDASTKTTKNVQIGGHNGSNAYTWHVNAQGQGKITNDSLGDPADAVATTDTGTWSIPSLLKKLNQSITSLLGRFGTLGQKVMSGSTPVVIASDQTKISVQTDERPSASAGDITPSNSIGFGGTSRGIYVGVSGDVSAVVNGLTIVFKNAVAGTIIPIQATRVNATGTTATNLVVLF